MSIGLHVAAIGAAIWLTRVHTPPIVEIINPPIRMPQRHGDATPPGPSAPSPHHPRRKRPPPGTLLQPVATPPPEAQEPPVVDDTDDDADEPGTPGVIGSRAGMTSDPNGTGAGIGSNDIGNALESPRPFEEGRMTPPRLLAGPNPQYTEQALEHEIEGTMAVRCVVSETGVVTGCRVLRSLPYMDAAVLRALEQRRYAPATLGGRPVAVDYTFQLELKLP